MIDPINHLKEFYDIGRVIYGSNLRESTLQGLPKALETVLKLVSNILANPTEEKFKKLRCQNALVKRITKIKGMECLLNSLGFYRKMIAAEPKNNHASKVLPREEAFIFDGSESSIQKLSSFQESGLESLNKAKFITSGLIKFGFESSFLFATTPVGVFSNEDTLHDLYKFVEHIIPPRYRETYKSDNLILALHSGSPTNGTASEVASNVLEDDIEVKLGQIKHKKVFGSTIRVFRKLDENQRDLQEIAMQQFEAAQAEETARRDMEALQRWKKKEKEKKEAADARARALFEFKTNREQKKEYHDRVKANRKNKAEWHGGANLLTGEPVEDVEPVAQDFNDDDDDAVAGESTD